MNVLDNIQELVSRSCKLTVEERYVLSRAYYSSGRRKYSDIEISIFSRRTAPYPLSRHQVRRRRISGLKKLGVLT